MGIAKKQFYGVIETAVEREGWESLSCRRDKMCYQSHKLQPVHFPEAGHLLSLVVVFPLVDQGRLLRLP